MVRYCYGHPRWQPVRLLSVAPSPNAKLVGDDRLGVALSDSKVWLVLDVQRYDSRNAWLELLAPESLARGWILHMHDADGAVELVLR